MGSIPIRICRISENLRVIQNDLAILAAQELEASFSSAHFGECDVRALRKVKLSVDHLRQVLRTYIDFASAQVDSGDSEALQHARSERTIQILRYACAGLQMREQRAAQDPASLFEQLTESAIAAVDRYQVAEQADVELVRAAAD